MRAALVTVTLTLTATALACRASPGRTDRMERPTLDVIARAPWGADLPRVLVSFPQRGDVAAADVYQAPALPRLRVDAAGRAAVLSYLDGGFASPTAVAWATVDGGGLTWRRAVDPFPERGALTAVDFVVGPDGALTLLEALAGGGARLVLAGADGEARGVVLDGGPYVRLVPDDRGGLYLVRHRDGTMVPLDRRTGGLGTPIALTPGSPAALAANRAAALPVRLLDGKPGGARVAAPPTVQQALVHLFGVDGAGDYYTVVDGRLYAVSFAGEVRAQAALSSVPGLAPATTGAVRDRVARPVDWQVDGEGRIYLARASADALELLRLTLPR